MDREISRQLYPGQAIIFILLSNSKTKNPECNQRLTEEIINLFEDRNKIK